MCSSSSLCRRSCFKGLCVVNWMLYDVVRMKLDDVEQERARCDRGILAVDEGGKVVVRGSIVMELNDAVWRG